MRTTESSPVPHSRGRRYRRRAAVIAGAAGTSLLAATGLSFATWDAYHPDTSKAARPPAATTPDTSSPSPLPSVSSTSGFPKVIAERGFPAAPTIHASSFTPTPSADNFCEVQKNPIEGQFDKNTGAHTIHASEDRQSIAIVSPDRSDVQQLRWKLPNQRDWITFNNDNSDGQAGIVFRTAVDVDVDTGGGRGLWYKECEENVDAAKSEIPSRVKDVFDKFGFGCVYVITVTPAGYVLQKVSNGEDYSQDIPSTFTPFK